MSESRKFRPPFSVMSIFNVVIVIAALLMVSTPTLSQVNVTIDPGAYQGQWSMFDQPVTQFIFQGTGTQNLSLDPGSYRVDVGESVFLVDVAANGDVTSFNTAAATGSNGVLEFNTQDVAISTGAYTATWSIARGVHSQASGGSITLDLVQSLDYGFAIGEDTFEFNVGSTGLVTENTAAAAGGQNSLALANVSVVVDPGDYLGDWVFTRGLLASTGGAVETITLVPALRYGIGINLSTFLFDIDDTGSIDVLNGISATGGPGTLTFNTVTISVDVGTFTGNWSVPPSVAAFVMGNGTVDLVPSINYQFFAEFAGVQQISVTDPCAVDPPSFDLAGHTFNLTCGPPDGDEDGVPDDTDNCATIPNPDQLDQDLDTIGDACDPDLDGDGHDNNVDNCPDIANPGQEDADGDDVGDACDGDLDGDGVANGLDNCPTVANTGQGDNDMDGDGDACDTDDDNDGVEDGIDNCPFTSNAGQEDFDGDGDGDVCDDDTDADGVPNALDRCDLSPLGQPVNSDGCTGPQLIALQCVCEDYVQHGQYVSCVAHEATGAVAQGLMAPNEKARFVKEAAKNRCN